MHFTFVGETNTLGQVLRHRLANDERIAMSGVVVPLPANDRVEVDVQLKESALLVHARSHGLSLDDPTLVDGATRAVMHEIIDALKADLKKLHQTFVDAVRTSGMTR